ncbi:hypothetical protein HDC94_002735 [Leifsonia sp. AK011]|uniref:hypothetical protein n=1 Tax=Leifsonia sp. AK011 TaxID=2723075 RepID=UPI0015CC7C92|nr:hypothetical protein [Leifsonia sp. AK011]NYF11579.1 hypothetical protein [Leifsonia sp. AK011]
MPHSTSTPWLNHLVSSTAIRRSGDGPTFYRQARAGHFTRLCEGWYVPTDYWLGLDTDTQFLLRIHAAARASRSGLLFSHLSAAALWRLPMVGAWPERPEATVGDSPSATRRAFTARRYPLPNDNDTIDGLDVTTMARTLIDVGRTQRLSTSVAMMDAALSLATDGSPIRTRVTRPELIDELSQGSARGQSRCADAVELADGASGSAGESLSRVGIHLLGLPKPQLQHEFRDERGRIVVDFWWPEFGLVGEFDGVGKYQRDEFRKGRTPGEVVVDEKLREDRLRALGPHVTRWGWVVASSLPALEAHLRSAGLR